MKPPKTLWTTDLLKSIFIAPIVIGNQALFATKPSSPKKQHSDLIALDLASGQVTWQYHFEYALINGLQAYTLLAEDQAICIVATQSSDLLRGQGQVLAFDETGRIVWQWHGEEKSYAAPVVQEMRVLLVAGTNTLAIVSPEGDGDELVRRINLSINTGPSAPAVRNNIIYVPCRTPDLLAINLNTSEQWRFHASEDEHNWLDQTPVLANGTLFTVGRRGELYALDSETLQLRWQQKIGEKRPLSQPAVDGDYLYVGFREGLSVLDSHNGQPRWSFHTSRAVSAPPLILGDVAYVSCEDHYLYALDKLSGVELWQLEMERRITVAPILTPSCLLIVDRGGQVVALEPPELPEAVRLELSASKQMRKELVAQRLIEQGELEKAAEFLVSLGKLEDAAEVYEQAGIWQQAAELWQQLDRDGKRADALEHYAQSLITQMVDDEEKAAAWDRAARAYAELRQKEARQRCEREVARYRRLPILTLDIEVKDLVIHQWSKLDFVVRNDGFSPARHVDVQLVDDCFVGRTKHSGTRLTILPSEQYEHWLEAQPQEQGADVPMRLSVEYVDRMGNTTRLARTFYLSVAPTRKEMESREFAHLKLPGGRNPATFRNNLVEHFSAEELDDLLFDLELRVDDFDQHVGVKAREIITWAAQHRHIDKLVRYCKEKRPFIDW